MKTPVLIHFTQIHDLNNVPLVSGNSYIKWHLAHSLHAEHRGRTGKCPIANHRVDYNYRKLIPSIRISIDKNNHLTECPIEFEVLQEFAVAEKITLGTVRLNLSEYVEESETHVKDVVSPRRRTGSMSVSPKSKTAAVASAVADASGHVTSAEEEQVEEGIVRRYLMQDSKINSTLRISILMVQVDGERSYVAPTLRTAPVFGGIAGLMAPEQVEDEIGPLPSVSKSRDQAEVQDLYRCTLAASWQRQPSELPADECIEDIFSGGNGWRTAGDGTSSEVDDADSGQYDTIRPNDLRRHGHHRRRSSQTDTHHHHHHHSHHHHHHHHGTHIHNHYKHHRSNSASSDRSSTTVVGNSATTPTTATGSIASSTHKARIPRHSRTGSRTSLRGGGGPGDEDIDERGGDGFGRSRSGSLASMTPTLNSDRSREHSGLKHVREVHEAEIRDDLVAWRLPGSRGLDVTPDATFAADLAGRHGDAQVGLDVNGDLDLGALLEAADGSLGDILANLPFLLALLLLLLVAEVGVILVILIVAVLSRLLSLGLGLGDLDVGVTLDNLDEDITAVLGARDLDHPAGGHSGLRGHDGQEDVAAVGAGSQDTNGVGDVLDGGDSRVGGLLNVGGFVFLDQGSLQGGTAGLQLRGVDSSSAGGGGEDGGGLGENATQVVGYPGSVRSTTAHDDLVDVQDIQLSLLDGALNQAVEALEDLAANHLVTQAVDGRGEVKAVSQALNAELGVGTQAEGALGSFGLETELGQALGDLIEVDTGELVVVDGGEDSVSDDDNLVLNLGLRAGVVSQDSGDGVRDELQDLEAGVVGGRGQRLTLLVVEVGGDGDDGRGDLLAQVVRGGLDEAAQEAGGGLGDGDGGGIGLAALVLDGEGDGARDILGVGSAMAVGGVDGLEAVERLKLAFLL
ncbi:hypothetical protein HJFPF1_05007 [Paramyrothecium foliicola]|nr:hypothetical protein HJFPF1_05007 [Paramyrothecium foliicola]